MYGLVKFASAAELSQEGQGSAEGPDRNKQEGVGGRGEIGHLVPPLVRGLWMSRCLTGVRGCESE